MAAAHKVGQHEQYGEAHITKGNGRKPVGHEAGDRQRLDTVISWLHVFVTR